MSHVDLGKFSCADCNRSYPWKPEYAGRKVKCKCGAVLTAPTEPPAPPAAEEDDDDDLLGGLYALAADEARAAKAGAILETGPLCPSCQQEMIVGEAVCPHCLFNLRTGTKAATPRPAGGAATGGAGNPMLAYAGMNKRSAADARAANANAVGGSELKELYVPAALVVLGLIAQLVLHGYVGGAWRGVAYALPGMGVALLINLVLSFVGVAIVASLFDLGFGAPGPAVLKMVAVCLLPPAIAEFIGNLVGADSAFVRHMIPAIVLIPIALVMFMLLFDLAYDEAIYTAVVIYLVNDWAVILLVALLMNGSLGGAGGVSPTQAVVRADETAAESVERPNATEARSWLAETGNHMYEGETHTTSLTLVAALYDAGAKRVTTLSSSGQGYALVVELPSKEEARAKVIAVIRQQEAAMKVPEEDRTEEQGQRYHTFEFGPG